MRISTRKAVESFPAAGIFAHFAQTTDGVARDNPWLVKGGRRAIHRAYHRSYFRSYRQGSSELPNAFGTPSQAGCAGAQKSVITILY